MLIRIKTQATTNNRTIFHREDNLPFIQTKSRLQSNDKTLISAPLFLFFNLDRYPEVYCYAFLTSMVYPGALNSLYAAAVWIASYALVAIIGLLQISCFIGTSIFN
ncbi:hypothetical protein L1987_77724 [Smallanthus sonchifolius]|uniref:Uncharacterized protein n=1 Tax=Smallanthus sonchifolius TaxID=185202 RepID=A0ACB8Z9T5_9ASTR|nr:hypothetical protein L1987_77724 [Smallanthus sonchifolius]